MGALVALGSFRGLYCWTVLYSHSESLGLGGLFPPPASPCTGNLFFKGFPMGNLFLRVLAGSSAVSVPFSSSGSFS